MSPEEVYVYLWCALAVFCLIAGASMRVIAHGDKKLVDNGNGLLVVGGAMALWLVGIAI